jgi:hypothetical protein
LSIPDLKCTIILVVGRLRKKEYEFEGNLCYIVSSRAAIGLHTLSQKANHNNKKIENALKL